MVSQGPVSGFPSSKPGADIHSQNPQNEFDNDHFTFGNHKHEHSTQFLQVENTMETSHNLQTSKLIEHNHDNQEEVLSSLMTSDTVQCSNMDDMETSPGNHHDNTHIPMSHHDDIKTFSSHIETTHGGMDTQYGNHGDMLDDNHSGEMETINNAHQEELVTVIHIPNNIDDLQNSGKCITEEQRYMLIPKGANEQQLSIGDSEEEGMDFQMSVFVPTTQSQDGNVSSNEQHNKNYLQFNIPRKSSKEISHQNIVHQHTCESHQILHDSQDTQENQTRLILDDRITSHDDRITGHEIEGQSKHNEKVFHPINPHILSDKLKKKNSKKTFKMIESISEGNSARSRVYTHGRDLIMRSSPYRPSMLSSEVDLPSEELPAILTEGDAEESEDCGNFSESENVEVEVVVSDMEVIHSNAPSMHTVHTDTNVHTVDTQATSIDMIQVHPNNMEMCTVTTTSTPIVVSQTDVTTDSSLHGAESVSTCRVLSQMTDGNTITVISSAPETEGMLAPETYQVVSSKELISSGLGDAAVLVTQQNDSGLIQVVSPSSLIIPQVSTEDQIYMTQSTTTQTNSNCMQSGTSIIVSDSMHDYKGMGSRGQKLHICAHPGCGRVWPKASKLKLHMLTHTGERPFKCDFEGCEWAFTTAYKLKRHMRGHTGERPFVCNYEGCGKCFTTAYNLKTHTRGHYRSDCIMCSYESCGRTFSSSHKLRTHERKHQIDPKPFKCEVDGCGKEFSAVGTLTSHVRMHSGERPHPCPIDGCCKRFTKASKLKLHLRTHTGERPFACDVEACGWAFTSAYKLKRHMRKHTGERPFQCHYNTCGKAFTRASHLKTHLLTHTGEKPYSCPVDGCNKAFTASSSLTVHMRKHTGEKPFKCAIDACPKAYTTAANLRAHMRRHNGVSGSSTTITSDSVPTQVDFTVISAEDTQEGAETPYTVMHSFSSDDFNPEEVAVQFTTSDSFVHPLSVTVSSDNSHVTTNLVLPNTETYVTQHGHYTHTSPRGLGASDVHVSAHDGETVTITDGAFPGQEVGAQYVLEDGQTGQQYVVQTTTDRNEFQSPTSPTPSNTVPHELFAQQNTPDGSKSSFDLSHGDLTVASVVCYEPVHDDDDKVLSSRNEQQVLTEDLKDQVTISADKSVEFTSACISSSRDGFVPPAVIFQDEILKCQSTDNERDADKHETYIPTHQEIFQSHLRGSLPQDNLSMQDTRVQTEDITHGTHPIAPGSISFNTNIVVINSEDEDVNDDDDDSLHENELSPYMENQNSDEPGLESYTESTINMQDLR